eukprot:GGOE01003566.1.p1 GENE.GGOE01003566.1~~GGOE01003566.1.p1  ORF type:complete len:370 (-),score=94.42 GGOE01003566.1:558-1667(-)
MAFRKFAAANTRLGERFTERVTLLEASQRELNKLESQILKVASELLEHAEQRPCCPRPYVLDCVLAYLKLVYTMSETLNLMSTMTASWARTRPRELLVPADLNIVEDVLASVQSATASYRAVLHGIPSAAFGRLLARAIACLRKICGGLQDAPLFNAGFLRTIFETVTPLKHGDLEDFMLERFHSCLEECEAMPLEDRYAEAYAATCDIAAADDSLPAWSRAVAERCRLDRAPSSPCEDEDRMSGRASPVSLGAKSSSIRLSSTRRRRNSLLRLRQFNAWVVWMIGCALELPVLKVSAFCTRLVASDSQERRSLIEGEVQQYLADPEFDAVKKAARVRSLIVEFCEVPVQLQADLQASAAAGAHLSSLP